MKCRAFVWTVLCLLLVSQHARSAFHLMEIEQVIGGVNGDASIQAVQLQLRGGSQNSLSGTRIVARDAQGANPVVLFDFTGNGPSTVSGSRILLTSSGFNTLMGGVRALDGTTPFSTNFTLQNTIPLSYLTGGRITFEQDGGGSPIWSLAWGSYNYPTKTNAGTVDNDDNGDYGTPFASALPTDGRALLFKTLAFNVTTKHTTNAADYSLTGGFATVVNASAGGTGAGNSNGSFVVVPEPGTASLLALGGLTLSGMAWSRRRKRA
jgi:hypothetical protein